MCTPVNPIYYITVGFKGGSNLYNVFVMLIRLWGFADLDLYSSHMPRRHILSCHGLLYSLHIGWGFGPSKIPLVVIDTDQSKAVVMGALLVFAARLFFMFFFPIRCFIVVFTGSCRTLWSHCWRGNRLHFFPPFFFFFDFAYCQSYALRFDVIGVMKTYYIILTP